jgi:hypothetical protein
MRVVLVAAVVVAAAAAAGIHWWHHGSSRTVPGFAALYLRAQSEPAVASCLRSSGVPLPPTRAQVAAELRHIGNQPRSTTVNHMTVTVVFTHVSASERRSAVACAKAHHLLSSQVAQMQEHKATIVSGH